MGEPPELFMVLWGLWRVHVQRVALQTARQYGERLLALAQRRSDPALMLVSHLALGAPLYFLGEFDAAHAHLEQGLTFSDPDPRRALAISHGIAPEIQCLVYSAPVLWSLGYPDQALRSAQQACSLARELAHPQSLVLALYWTAVIHQRRGEAEAAYEMSDACLRLATEHEFALFVAQGQFQRGWALAALDRSDVGLAQMRDGVAAQLATGTKVGVSAYSSLLAETYAQMGQIDEARVVLAAALATLDESEQRYYKAEMFRLDGELDILRPEPAYGRAEARLQQALEVARRQHARSWELRAAISLARLWQRQGRRREARELLSAVYGWFTEGFETADLRAASALLEELQAPDGSVYRPVGPTA